MCLFPSVCGIPVAMCACQEKMMFCDHCDRGYHTFCVGLKVIPAGRWECPSCAPAAATPPKPKSATHLLYFSLMQNSTK